MHPYKAWSASRPFYRPSVPPNICKCQSSIQPRAFNQSSNGPANQRNQPTNQPTNQPIIQPTKMNSPTNIQPACCAGLVSFATTSGEMWSVDGGNARVAEGLIKVCVEH
eukprot:366455-Chlamydomonas_euryale.AAC.7